jgi:uncharacterized Ntn-hydrolase superfamily protein
MPRKSFVAKECAESFRKAVRDYGWNYTVVGSIVKIHKVIHGMDDFVTADSEYYGILECLPQTEAGSIWGTDGGGVGGIAAINSGVFRMNKSGVSKRVLKLL